MNKKSLSTLTLLLVLALLALPAAVSAQDTTGGEGTNADLISAPADGSGANESAFSPTGEWRTITAGAQHWYRFRYGGDNQDALVFMNASPANEIEFDVWTQAQLEQLGFGADIDPIGRGTANELAPGDLSWSGGSPQGETYFVVVRARDTLQGEGGYALTAQGNGVGLFAAPPAATAEATPAATAAPAGTTAPAATPAPEGTPAATATPAAPTPGGGPADAATTFGEWTTIEPGQSHWYSFNYAGNDAPALVWLDSSPSNAVGFSVWTDRQVEQREDDPLGRGTANEFEQGDISWFGASPEQATYFIVVTITDNNHMGPASYMLQAEGSGVRLIQTPAAGQ